MAYPESFLSGFRAKTGPADSRGCLPWLGTLNGQGYGLMWRGGERYAHRHSYRIHKGAIPPGKLVRHRCDNKRCVNPDHLLLGTKRDNAKDALERNRFSSGPDRRPDLTRDMVFEARQDFHEKGVQLSELSDRLGMCMSQTSDVMWGRLWRSTPMPTGVRPRARRRKLKRDYRRKK
jgi:hypothetical protein